LAKEGRYDEAIAAYDRALELQPKMEDAIENRKVVGAARKRKAAQDQQQQQQKKSSGQDSPGSDKGKPQPGQQGKQQAKPDSKQSDSPQQQQSPQPSQQQGKKQSPEQNAADAKAQQAADAAQRERMARAIGQAGKGEQKDASTREATAAIKETPAQREHRQAVEAWLRRVPDEPGNLLKTKFRLEYERRQREGR